VFVVRDLKFVKKAYVAPSFDVHVAATAKAALEAGASQNPQVEEMLVLINQRPDEKTSASGSSEPRSRVP